jgi:hypothetical protein
MMLANQQRKLLVNLALSFSLVAACCAAYIGYLSYAKGMASYIYTGVYWNLGACIFVSWFIALAFLSTFASISIGLIVTKPCLIFHGVTQSKS